MQYLRRHHQQDQLHATPVAPTPAEPDATPAAPPPAGPDATPAAPTSTT